MLASESNAMERIAVVGTSCSGKTHFTKRLTNRLQISHIELDKLYWGPNWTPVETDDFRERVDHATLASTWACDGNYHSVRDMIWKRADTIVWLNYPFSVVYSRAVRRTFTRCFKKTKLYSDNQESFRKTLFSRDSMLLWVLRTYWKHRNEYPALFQAKEWSHLNVVLLRNPKEAERFLETLGAVQ